MDKTNSKKDIKKGFSDVEVEDMTSGVGSKDTHSFKELALRQYEKCCKVMGMEMTRGGLIEREMNGQIIKYYSEDTIALTINNIKTLNKMLVNQIEERPKFAKLLNRYDNSLTNLKKKYTTELKNINKWYSKLSNVPNPNKEYLSEKEINYSIYKKRRKHLKHSLDKQELKIHTDFIFVELTRVMGELNFFEPKGSTI